MAIMMLAIMNGLLTSIALNGDSVGTIALSRRIANRNGHVTHFDDRHGSRNEHHRCDTDGGAMLTLQVIIPMWIAGFDAMALQLLATEKVRYCVPLIST